jgi:hypothetical protein
MTMMRRGCSIQWRRKKIANCNESNRTNVANCRSALSLSLSRCNLVHTRRNVVSILIKLLVGQLTALLVDHDIALNVTSPAVGAAHLLSSLGSAIARHTIRRDTDGGDGNSSNSSSDQELLAEATLSVLLGGIELLAGISAMLLLLGLLTGISVVGHDGEAIKVDGAWVNQQSTARHKVDGHEHDERSKRCETRSKISDARGRRDDKCTAGIGRRVRKEGRERGGSSL